MPYLIDGHNLIPKISGLSLENMDDEQKLIEMLQEFCRLKRKRIEVFFDKAAPGGARARNFGAVTARFVRQESTADRAIHQRLIRLGRAARNWTVVSSDHAVQSEARAAQAHAMPSEEFAALLAASLDEGKRDLGSAEETNLSPEELDEWLHLFGGRGKD
jgi:predicted RNA-binding protein with PIN domain